MQDPSGRNDPQKKVLVIGWDAADWKVINPLIDQGKMPHTAALVERGVMGDLATLHPVLSPMLWTTHRHRQAALQARHPRLHRADPGRRLGAAGLAAVAQDQGDLEHPQPAGPAQPRDRLVAEPPGRADQRGDGLQSLPHRGRAARGALAARTRHGAPEAGRGDAGGAAAQSQRTDRRAGPAVCARGPPRSTRTRIGAWPR